MAQLTDDCFAFAGPLLAVDDLERIICERVQPVAEIETVPLTEALGRVTARDISAPIDLPPFDNSAVDGYAVRHADLVPNGETHLRIADRVTAGRAAAHSLGQREAIRIFTGAPMPHGADTVFMQEDCRVENGIVVVPSGLKIGANRRLAGEDLDKNAIAIPAGRLMSVQQVSLAAAIGLTDIPVRRRLRTALFSTGDEIVEPGTMRPQAALFDANRFLLSSLLKKMGVVVTDLGILPDDQQTIESAVMQAAADHDLVLTSGGVSTGEADHVRTAVEKIGRLVFWRVAIKPGRPVAMGIVGGSAFVGLPGNPVAAFVTFVRVVRPLLLRLGGAQQQPLMTLPVRASFSYRKKQGRREYVRVALHRAPDGAVDAVKHRQEGAGVITSLTETDGLVELAENITTVEPGSTVGFIPYSALLG